MARLQVVYDTNIYRKLDQVRFELITRLERAYSIIGVASASVGVELLCRADSTDGADYASAKAALGPLCTHCRGYDGSRSRLRVLPTLEALIRFQVFNIQQYSREEAAAARVFTWLIGQLAQEMGTVPDSTYREALAEVGQLCRSVESTFEHSLWGLAQEIAPAVQNWSEFNEATEERERALADLVHPRAEVDAAKALAGRVATSLTQLPSTTARQLGPSEVDALAHWIHTRMPRVTKLFVEVLVSLISSAPDMTKSKHRNTTWDLRIASEVLGYAAVEPASICLVIDDKRIVEAARRSGSSPLILSLSDYEMALSKGTSLVTSPSSNSMKKPGDS